MQDFSGPLVWRKTAEKSAGKLCSLKPERLSPAGRRGNRGGGGRPGAGAGAGRAPLGVEVTERAAGRRVWAVLRGCGGRPVSRGRALPAACADGAQRPVPRRALVSPRPHKARW